MDRTPVRELSGFGDLDTGAALDALGDQRRRAVVRALATAHSHVSVRELASQLAAMPNAGTRDPDRTVVELHHRTLPKLDGLGIVAYDAEARVVEPREPVADLLSLVEHVEFTSRER
ncbi:DUF7344 domain-containing protein [Halorientalis halophila]|uniref:DUF7344 domain-containing protein n=1 Tax=Halorientalis halophila TaxID=3108499 RepID=UPI003009B1A5